MDIILNLGYQLFGEFTNIVGALAVSVDGVLGVDILKNFGAETLATLVLLGMFFD